MTIKYIFEIDEVVLEYEIDVNREYEKVNTRADAPEWTQLQHEQCTNCPLSRIEHKYCPAAIDLQRVITDFESMPAIKEAVVKVETPERNYEKKVKLEEGLRSLMGLIMATCACPILAQLKPNANNHLPFATQEEFIVRSTAFFLLRQYFLYREGYRPDWELQGLIKLNQQLQTVNEALWRRINSACKNDSNLQALLSFVSMSSSVSFSLESQLQQIKTLVLHKTDGLAIRVDGEPKSYLE